MSTPTWPPISSTPDLNVLVLVYPNYNTLDMTGPLDVICSSAIEGKRVNTTVAAADELTPSFEGLKLRRDVSFGELVAASDDVLASYDLLLVPGGDRVDLERAIAEGGLVGTVKRYVALGSKGGMGGTVKRYVARGRKGGIGGGKERWVMSVCTGAVFLGAAGVLKGRTATTHFRYLEYLAGICEREGGGKTEVVRKRFVDAGRTEEGGLRLLTAGGVICGIDAALWFVKERFGTDTAKSCATLMDYQWQLEEVRATEGYLV